MHTLVGHVLFIVIPGQIDPDIAYEFVFVIIFIYGKTGRRLWVPVNIVPALCVYFGVVIDFIAVSIDEPSC